MAVRCFTRKERDGMYVIQPLEGRSKLDCMIVNETVKFVYDRVVEGLSFAGLTAAFLERARREVEAERRREQAGNGSGAGKDWIGAGDHGSDEERFRFDLYRILISLSDREIADYSYTDLVALLPAGRILKGTTQVMPICMLEDASAFLKQAFATIHPPVDADAANAGRADQGVDTARAGHAADATRANRGGKTQASGKAQTNGTAGPSANGGGGVRLFYAFPADVRVGPAYFEPQLLARRHLDQFEVCFLALDSQGQIEACSIVQGLPLQPATLMIFCCAARYDSQERFEDRVGIHLSRLSGLLQVTTLSPKIRFQYATAGDPPVHLAEDFHRMIGELGFRRALTLPDELGPGSGLLAYDRPLF